MTDTNRPPIEAIAEVVRWLALGVESTSNPRHRFYASLVIDILTRPNGLSGTRDVLSNYSLHYHEDGPYSSMFRWIKSNSAYQLEGIVVQRTDGQPFLASELRSLPWRTLIDADVKARLSDAELVEVMGDLVSEFGIDEARSAWDEAPHKQHREVLATSSRRRYDDSHYDKVARLYDEAIVAGSRSPNRYIGEQMGVESRSTVKNWVVECRRRGLLPPTTERRAKGNN